jgi:hypothetical protein
LTLTPWIWYKQFMPANYLLTLCFVVSTASVADILNAVDSANRQGPWVVASNGTELPFMTRSGKMLQYCYQPSTGDHAYLDCGTDLILSNEEACCYLGTR